MSEGDSYDAVVKALKMMKRLRKMSGTIFINEGVMLSADTPYTEEQNAAYVRELNALTSLHRNSDQPLERALLGFDGGNVMVFHNEPFTISLFFDDPERAGEIEKYGEEFLGKFSGPLGIESFSGSLSPISGDDLPTAVETTQSENLSKTTAASPESEAESDKPDQTVQPDPEPAPVEEPKEEMQSDPSSNQSEENQAAIWESYRGRVETLFCKVLGHAQAKRVIQRELTAMGVGPGQFLKPSQFRPFGQKLTARVRDTTIRKQLDNELDGIVEEHLQ